MAPSWELRSTSTRTMPALGADELLRRRQTYFVLPVGMLGRPLASADMAALAVRASDALAAKARMARAAGTARRGLTEAAAERLEAAEAELPGCGGWSLGRRRASMEGGGAEPRRQGRAAGRSLASTGSTAASRQAGRGGAARPSRAGRGGAARSGRKEREDGPSHR
ncbi:uncharacterized protein LOC120662653 [Panicum virgatum]|uniref:Uncharacterized protein n=1 Tax=Panicum virgatum TaxID=38727 RepID=A0A8T0VJ97_PANVG|nr:uncharacterized protein LOC120662653 [Panicum virgatum]KAG2634888.1 hypothetical protein PVAP13_2NG324303 [Panicum virgatum]